MENLLGFKPISFSLCQVIRRIWWKNRTKRSLNIEIKEQVPTQNVKKIGKHIGHLRKTRISNWSKLILKCYLVFTGFFNQGNN